MTLKEFLFRTYCPGDEVKLANLLAQCLIAKYSPDDVLKQFENKPNDCFIAENEDHEIVACLFVVWRELHIGDGIFIKVGGISGVCTHPNYRRQGFMTLLLSKAHKYIREKGGVLSCLFTSEKIYPNAYKLFKEMGYVEAQRLLSIKRNNSLVSSVFRLFSLIKWITRSTGTHKIKKKDEVHSLVSLKNKVFQSNMGYMKRTEDDLITRLDRHNLGLNDVLCFGEQTLKGYIIQGGGFRFRRVLEVCFDSSDVEIKENVLEHLKILSRSTLNFVHVWPMNSSVKETIKGEFCDEKIFMVRVINTSKFLDYVKLKGKLACERLTTEDIANSFFSKNRFQISPIDSF